MIELVVLLSAILITFRREFIRYVKENHSKAWESREGLLRYAAASILLGTAISIFPALMINAYMRANGFYAYEVFQSDQLPFAVLTLNAWLVLAAISVSLFAFIPAIAAGLSLREYWPIALFNIALIIFVGFLTWRTGDWFMTGLMLIVPLCIASYAAWILRSSIEDRARNWRISIALAAVLITTPVVFGSALSPITSRVLGQLNVGGQHVVVTDLGGDSPAPRCYFLVLRTNDYLYLKARDRAEETARVMRLENFTLVKNTTVDTEDGEGACPTPVV